MSVQTIETIKIRFENLKEQYNNNQINLHRACQKAEMLKHQLTKINASNNLEELEDLNSEISTFILLVNSLIEDKKFDL